MNADKYVFWHHQMNVISPVLVGTRRPAKQPITWVAPRKGENRTGEREDQPNTHCHRWGDPSSPVAFRQQATSLQHHN